MHVHLIGVCGTGMGPFAGLLKQAGHRVTGSDAAFMPPMSDALERWGIETMTSFDPSHLDPAPDLVVIGNVCRPSNIEAKAAIEQGLRYASFPAALRAMFLEARRSFVVAGTHGKTTTSALLAYLLDACGQRPGFLIGGLPLDLAESFRQGAPGGPFVVEGDEYDSAFFEKTPKFWQYVPQVLAISSVEHDHVDIYPDMAAYRAAFVELVRRMPESGLLVANAADHEVRAIAREARCRVSYYALDGQDTGDVTPTWLGALAPTDPQAQPFDLFFGGSSCGRVTSPLAGAHNVGNAIAAIAMAAEGAGVAVHALASALTGFSGVRRRQELRGVADGVRVYDDFAHHPTAVAATVSALRARHREGRLWAAFEPRSATSARKLHEPEYAAAFTGADVVLLAPVGRSEVPEHERLDVQAVARAIAELGARAEAVGSVDAIVASIVELAQPGDTVLAMSNGAFGQIHDKLLAGLGARAARARRRAGS